MSRPAVEFREPTPDDIEYLAAHMREQDIAECAAGGHHDLPAVLRSSVALSSWSVAAWVDGELAALLGVVPLGTLLDTRGAPWLLGTDAVPRHRRVLARHTPGYIQRMLAEFPHLMNVVHARNTVSVQWLRRMGFVLGPEFPHPVTGEPFHLFEMRSA